MTTEALNIVALLVVIGFLNFLLWDAHRSIKTLVEALRITLISVTGKEEMELRRLAMARRMQAPKTHYPTPSGPVTTELLDALKRRPGIRNTGDRQTLVMGSRDNLGESNAPLPGTQQKSENGHP